MPTPSPGREPLGIVGGGQLAQMMTQAASALGIEVVVLDPDPSCPAAAVGARILVGDCDDLEALTELASQTSAVTLDHEQVSIDHLRALETAGHQVGPGPEAAQLAVDKLIARRRLSDAGYPVPAFAHATGTDDIVAFAADHGWPVVAKVARGGYDGRGVAIVGSPEEAAAVGFTGDMVVEEFVAFDGEVSAVVARRRGGEVAPYPLAWTVQRDGMCDELFVPAPVSPDVERRAAELASSLADEIGLVGIMAVELFVRGDDILINELATRPHNTAHHTIEANETSQFEQHVRAVLDLPLGSVEPRSPASAMCNVVARSADDDPRWHLADALAVEGAHPHLYGKAPKPGRKVGHVTVLADTAEEALATARRARGHLEGSPDAARIEGAA